MAKCEKYRVIFADPFKVQIALFRSFADLETTFPNAPTVARANAAVVMWHDDGQAWFAMVIPKKLAVTTIAHECVHAADFIMENCGVPAEGNTEVRAYLMEHIMQQVIGG